MISKKKKKEIKDILHFKQFSFQFRCKQTSKLEIEFES